MSTFYHFVDHNQNIIASTFTHEMTKFIPKLENSKSNTFVYNNLKAKIGSKSSAYGTVYIFTYEVKYLKRHKTFNQLINTHLTVLETLPKIKESIISEYTLQTKTLVHNLTSLNSYTIQSLFALVPQDLLSKNINKQNDVVKEILKEQPKVAASTILKLIKYSLSMKIEFSVFQKSTESRPIISKLEYSIRKIVLSILHIFIEDFEEKKITVSLQSSERSIEVDYDSLSVSLFYFLENATKYCLNSSSLKINFQEDNNNFYIIFDMISLRIEDHEINKICDLGYRSENAKRANINGEGIGLFQLVKTLKLNNADLIIQPRFTNYSKIISGKQYEHNLFKIVFNDQPKWFH